jgi:sec-independent protein translocase protein TatA
MFGLGTPELVLLILLVLLLFGGAKIPQMMRGLGEGMREFKKSTRDDDDTTTTSTPNNRTQV